MKAALICGVVGSLAASIAVAADFAGTWSISSKVGENPVSIVCTLVQKRDALSGSCQPQGFDRSELEGAVTASTAKWGYDVLFNGNRNHVEYEATLQADGTLAGTLHLGAMPVPFTAVRQGPQP